MNNGKGGTERNSPVAVDEMPPCEESTCNQVNASTVSCKCTVGRDKRILFIVNSYSWHKQIKATASLTTPSKTHFFLHSCRFDLWEFPCFWTSGLKPPIIFIFHTSGMAGQHNYNFCWCLHCFVKPFFFFQEVLRAKERV